MKEFKGKVVIITGASSGIGRATAIEFGKRGATLVLAARNESLLKDCVKEVEIEGGKAIAVKCDVSIQSDCENLINSTIEAFNKIDVLINNAGISMRAIFEEVDLSVLKQLMQVNFWGTVYCTKYALPYLLKSKGSVVGVSSIAGYQGLPGRTGYSASKFAMHGFLETLRVENLKKDLHVLIACPGFTSSNIRNTALSKDGSAQGETPRDEQKMMTSEEVALHIANAVGDRKNTLTLTTEGKLVVFLKKFFPNFVDKQVYKAMLKENNSPLK